jgi:mannose-6-phosphate isomerase
LWDTAAALTDDPSPKIVAKPWGSELWFAANPRYAGKLLRIDGGQRLSVQKHAQKDETSHLLSGRVLVSQGESVASLVTRELGPGETWRNEPGVVHTIEALEDSVVVEVSTPEVDDVIRLEDRYGRAGAEPSA